MYSPAPAPDSALSLRPVVLVLSVAQAGVAWSSLKRIQASQNVMSLFSFVFVQHFGLACGAALLFLVGALLAFPVVKHGSPRLTRMPLILFRWVRRTLGTHPGMIRLWSLIFGFNGTVMLLYMASGVHPAFPAAISFLTGYNIAVILLLAGELEDLDGLAVSSASGWTPGKWVAGMCGLAVLLLELPCFWYSIAMGIRLGQAIVAGQTSYVEGISVRLHAYALLILPTLLVSAVCEAIAIRGMSAPAPHERPPQGSGTRDQGSGPCPSAPHTGGGQGVA